MSGILLSSFHVWVQLQCLMRLVHSLCGVGPPAWLCHSWLTHPSLDGYWVVTRFCLLKIILLWIFLLVFCWSLVHIYAPTMLAIYLRVEWQYHRCIFSQLSKELIPNCISINSACESQLLQSFTLAVFGILVGLIFTLVSLVSVCWYLIMV